MRQPAGMMRDCVRIDSFDRVDDPETGAPIDQWTPLREARAYIKPMRATERYSARSEIDESMVKISIDHHKDLVDIDPTHRVVDIITGTIYDIEGVIDVNNLHRTLELMCKKRLKDQ